MPIDANGTPVHPLDDPPAYALEAAARALPTPQPTTREERRAAAVARLNPERKVLQPVCCSECGEPSKMAAVHPEQFAYICPACRAALPAPQPTTREERGEMSERGVGQHAALREHDRRRRAIRHALRYRKAARNEARISATLRSEAAFFQAQAIKAREHVDAIRAALRGLPDSDLVSLATATMRRLDVLECHDPDAPRPQTFGAALRQLDGATSALRLVMRARGAQERRAVRYRAAAVRYRTLMRDRDADLTHEHNERVRLEGVVDSLLIGAEVDRARIAALEAALEAALRADK